MRFNQAYGMYLPETIRPQNRGYGDAGASTKKKALKGFHANSGAPQDDIDFHNATLRQRARMLYMASPFATSAIKVNRTNIVGIGLRLKSRIDPAVLKISETACEEWQRNTEKEFALWAKRKESCDVLGANNFYSLQQLALMSWLVSGDCFVLIKQNKPTALHPYRLRLHLIEADRVATPTGMDSFFAASYTSGKLQNGNYVYDGVEVDTEGRIEAYHIRNNYPYELQGLKETKWVRVAVRGKHTGLPNILHLMNAERPDQYRGVSYLAQVIEPLLQLRRYTESEIMAAMVESFFTAFIKTELPQDQMPINQVGDYECSDPDDYAMGPGQINILKPGESIDTAEPKRPARGFDLFVHAICEQVGAALEIPAEVLTKSFNSSYSASRAALMEAWKTFSMYREWFVGDFCDPVYEIWLSEAIASGRIQAPGFFLDPIIREAYLGCEWIGQSQGQLDPVKEVMAEILAIEQGFTTREQSTIRINGGQWGTNMNQLKRENEVMKEVFGTIEPENAQQRKEKGSEDDRKENRTRAILEYL